MKKINYLIFVSLTTLFLIFTACDNPCECEPCEVEKNDCTIKLPKDLKPIDWENYNDVYTVYWNLVRNRSGGNSPLDHDGDTIKISGWNVWSYSYFNYLYLCDDAKYAIPELGYTGASPTIPIGCWTFYRTILDSCNLTKKCFVKGVLGYSSRKEKECLRYVPTVHIMDINDIYFE